MISDADVRSPRSVLRAALWSVGTLAAICLLAVAGREATRALPTVQVLFHRGWISLVAIVFVAALTRSLPRVLITHRLPLHIWRNAVHFTAQFLWFYALTLIPLADVFALEFTMPLWLALMAPLVLGERLDAWRVAAVILGFVGALVVIRPAGAGLGIGSIAALTSAAGYAFSVMAVKQLTRTDSAITILFWMSLLQCLYAIVLTLATGELSWPAPVVLAWLVAVAASGLMAHYCMARAFALADTLIVAPMDFLRLPLIALLGVSLYAEPLDWMVLAGGAIIISANVLNLLAERRMQRK